MVFDPEPRGRRGMGGGWGRRRFTTETKHALKTTEFWVFAAVLTALMIASYVIGDDESGGTSGDGGGDIFRADEAWRLATFLTIGYLISRGLAKAGSREPYWEEPEDRNNDGGSDGGAAQSRQTVGARQSGDDY